MSPVLMCYVMFFILAVTPLAIPALGRGDRPAWAPELWSLGFAEGTVAWGYGLFLFNFLGGRMTRAGVLAGLIGTGVAALWRLRSLFRTDIKTLGIRLPYGFSWWPESAGLALILWAVVIAWLQTVSLPLYHFDAVAHFGFFGKVLYVEGTYRVPSLFDNRFFHSAPEYPYLIPYLEALLYQTIGSFHDGLVKHLFLAYWLAFIATVYTGMRWGASRRTAVLGTAVLATLPLLSADSETQAVSGCTDIAFALYWTWLALSAIRYRQAPDRIWLTRMVLFSVGCSFTKPNGAMVVLIPWTLMFLAGGSRRRDLLPGAAAGVAILVPWLWTSWTLHTGGYKEPIHWEPRTLVAAVHQLPGMLVAIGQELRRISNWGLFWWVCAGALGAGLWRKRLPPAAAFLLSVLGLQFLLYAGAYLVMPESAIWWVQATFSRWLIHFISLLAIALLWIWDRES